MDLSLYLLGGLVASGYFLKNKHHINKNKRHIDKDIDIDKNKRHDPNHSLKSGGGNILDYRQFDQVQSLEEQLASIQYDNSQNGNKITPFYYRWAENSDLQRTKNPDFNPNAIPNELSGGGDRSELEINNNWSAIPYNRNNQIDQGVVRTHNNMVPFFGSNLKQNVNPDSVLASRKLEDFTGNRMLDQTRKQEVERLFAPVAQNLDQLVPLREEDRFVPSNLGKRNNEIPFKQENVGPGLNAGYTSTPSGGLHNTVRILPKDNDALYVNPRTTHAGRVLRGKNRVDAPTSQSLMYKYRPETLVTNFDGERNMITTGAVKNPTSRPRMDLKPTSRQQFTEYYAAQGRNILNTPENLFAKHKPSDRQNFMGTPFRNLEAIGSKRAKPDYTYNHENRQTERAVTGPRHITTLSNLKAAVQKAYTALFDNAKKTRGEDYIYHPRESGNIASTSKQKGHVYNETSVAKTTGRETIEINSHAGNLAKTREHGPVQFIDEAKTTTRELLENNSHTGNVQAQGQTKTKIINTLDQARTTGRETIDNLDYVGGAIGRKAGKSAIIDQARTTGRETIDNVDYIGGATTGRKATKSALIDSAKTTIRETTDVNDYLGGARGHQAGTVSLTDTAKTTGREMIETNDYLGGVGKSRQAGQTILTDFAKTTGRETLEANDYLGGVGKSRQAGQTSLTDNAKTTGRETLEASDYLGGVGKGRQAGQTSLTDNAKTTGRETLEASDYYGGVGKGRRAGQTSLTDNAKTTGRETLETGDYYGGVGDGRRAGKTPLVDNAKTTGRETIDGGDYLGGIGKGRQAPITAHTDDAKTTHRETHETASRIGPAQDPNLAGGKGYLTAKFSDKPTQRQFSHVSYTGNAAPKGLAESQRLYDEAYNMRQNINKEKVAKGRTAQNGYLPLHNGKSSTNICVKKLDEDRKNHYGFAPNPVFPNGRIPESACRLTSFKNNPPSEYSRLDTSLVESLLDNPLHQSLQSAA